MRTITGRGWIPGLLLLVALAVWADEAEQATGETAAQAEQTPGEAAGQAEQAPGEAAAQAEQAPGETAAQAEQAPGGEDAAYEAAGAQPAPEEPPASEAQAAPVDDNAVVYVPPSRGSARVRTGGGTRSPTRAPTVAVLAPDHVGLTWRAQPSLAWFVSGPTDARIDLTVVDPEAVDPLLEVTLPSPDVAGIYLVRLADHGVELAPGRVYDWSVALVLDPESRDLDVVASGAIRRDAPAPAVAAAIESGTPSHVALARAGVWYDAMADLSAAIASRPEDDALRAQRAALLEQVGVGAAAAYERENGSHGESPGSP